jgi:hypothetical protein
MAAVDLETAISDFLSLGRRLQAAGPLTGERVLQELTGWYRDVRIEGAALDEDGDMLLLQWGATRPLLFSEPTDLRPRRANLKFGTKDLQYLDFTRQVFAAGGDEDADFDDAAVQMSITLSYGPAEGTEKSANLWVNTPDDTDDGAREFHNTPFVRSLLQAPAQSVAVTVGYCG